MPFAFPPESAFAFAGIPNQMAGSGAIHHLPQLVLSFIINHLRSNLMRIDGFELPPESDKSIWST